MTVMLDNYFKPRFSNSAEAQRAQSYAAMLYRLCASNPKILRKNFSAKKLMH